MLALILSVVYLALLECLLSVDNALALAALVHARLPGEKDRRRALHCGMLGAYLFRLAVIAGGVWLMAHAWVKAAAGAYLLFMAAKELLSSGGSGDEAPAALRPSTLWRTVVAVEVMDLVFSVDSIAVTLSVSERFWALVGGAFLGIALMRFAATKVIRLIDDFPFLETVAFILVALAGARILAEYSGVEVPETFFAGAMLLIVGGSFLWDDAARGRLARWLHQCACHHSPIYVGIVMTMRGPCIKGRCVYCGKEAVGKCAVRSV